VTVNCHQPAFAELAVSERVFSLLLGVGILLLLAGLVGWAFVGGAESPEEDLRAELLRQTPRRSSLLTVRDFLRQQGWPESLLEEAGSPDRHYSLQSWWRDDREPSDGWVRAVWWFNRRGQLTDLEVYHTAAKR
jgi:hypothetical protein